MAMFGNLGNRNAQRPPYREANQNQNGRYDPALLNEIFRRQGRDNRDNRDVRRSDSTNFDPNGIANRLGYTPDELVRLLHRANRSGSNGLGPVRNQRYQCPSCDAYPPRGQMYCERHRDGRDLGLAGHPSPGSRQQGDKSTGVKTKDVAIRGKNYPIRQSFLSDNEKFEATIVKTADKKSSEALPEKIIQLMVDFINDEEYINANLADEVHLYIFAAMCNVKSLMKHSIERMKDDRTFDPVARGEVVDICCMVCVPPESDDKLKEWLKKTFDKEFGYENMDLQIQDWDEFQDACIDHPQLHRVLADLLGLFHDHPGRRKPRQF